MGLSTLIQIPCHHVLANKMYLNLKYCIGLKQNFHINLGICIIKKTTFLFVFLTYLPVFLLKFRLGELLGCEIKFCIQRVPTWHIFYGPRYPKNKKYLKKTWLWHFGSQWLPTRYSFDGPGCGCDVISMGWTGVNTTWDSRVGLVVWGTTQEFPA